MATKKKKVVSTIAAVATSAALLLGGTLAWQSANQVALNEASDVINPGGRLHDDFDGTNKDVYVENFTPEDTGEPIYARIRLQEYFEIVTNYDTAAEKVHTLVGTATATETDAASTDNTGESIVNIGTKFSGEKYERGYVTHIFTEENVASGDAAVDADGNAWWKWTLGGQTDYMPTYNLNKDSLMADVNGKFDGAVGTITDRDATDPDAQYTEDRQADFPYVEYTAGDTAEGFEVFDGDPNNIDEVSSQAQLLDMIENGNNPYPDNIVLSENKEVHTAATTLEGSLMSMAQWIAAGSQPGPYWVYDTDGWVYWAQAIEPGTATGLLLDGIELNQVMDDTWYYAINVIAQFVTADDVGKSDGTGFYDTEKGTAPTDAAEEFLKEIGVTSVSDAPAEDDDEPQTYDLILTADGANSVSATTKDSFNIGFDTDGLTDPAEADTTGIVVYQENASGYSLRSTPVALDQSQYSYAEGVLSLTDSALTGTLRVTDLNGVLYGFILLPEGTGGDPEEMRELDLRDTPLPPSEDTMVVAFGEKLNVVVNNPSDDESNQPDLSNVVLVAMNDTETHTETLTADQYSYADGVLTITDESLAGALIVVADNTGNYGAYIYMEDGSGGEEEEQFTVVLGSNYVSSYSTKATTAGYNTNTAALYEYGEPYAGTGVVTWRLEADLGDIDDTTIDNDGNISVGVELENLSAEYEIFKVIASIDGEEVASRNMLVSAYRSDNLPVHGFRFYDADGTEVPADQLVTGVTYTVESYMRLFVDGSVAMANGDPLTDYLPYYPVEQMQGIKIYKISDMSVVNSEVAAFSNGQFTAHTADAYIIYSEGGDYDLEYLLYQEVTASGGSGGEEEVVDTFTIEGTEMTDTQYFDYYLAEDAFIYTVNQEHTLHVDGLTNHLGGSPDTSKFSIYENSNYNVLEVFINKLTEEGPGINAEYLPTSVVWNNATSQYDITFTIPQEWVDAGIDAMMMRLVSYSADSDSWSAGPSGPYLVIMLEEAAGSGDPGDTVGPTFTVGDMTVTAVIDYNLTSGARVESGVYAGHEIQVTSSDLSELWTVNGIDVTPSTGVTDDGAHSHVTFTIPEDTPQGTEITVTQTVGDNSYTITLVVSELVPAPIINYAGDPSNIDDEGFITLAPGESAQFVFEDANGVLTNNAGVDWALTAMNGDNTVGTVTGMKLLEDSEDGCTATVYHTCEAGACICDGGASVITHYMVTLTGSDGEGSAECFTAYLKHSAGEAEYTAPTFSVADENTGMALYTNRESGWNSGYVYRGASLLISSTDMTANWTTDSDAITGTASQDIPAHKGYFRFTVPADFEGDTITVTQTGANGSDYSITLNVEDATLAVNITGSLYAAPDSYLAGSSTGYYLAVSCTGNESGQGYLTTGQRLSYLTYSAVNANDEAVDVDSNAYIYVTGQTTAITATVSWEALGLTASDTISPMSAEEAEESPLYTLLNVTKGYDNATASFEGHSASSPGAAISLDGSTDYLVLSTSSSNEWSISGSANGVVGLNTDHGYDLTGTGYNSSVLLDFTNLTPTVHYSLYLNQNLTNGSTVQVPHITGVTKVQPYHAIYDNVTNEQLVAAPLTDGTQGYRVFPGAQIRLESTLYAYNSSGVFFNSAGYNVISQGGSTYTFSVPDDAEIGSTFNVYQTNAYGTPLTFTYFEVIDPDVPLFSLTHMDGSVSHAYVAPHGADSSPIAVYPGDTFKVESTLEGEMSCDISHLAGNNGFGKIGEKLGYEDTDNYYLSLSSDTANLGQTATITQTVGGEPYSIVLEVIDDYLKIGYIEDNSLIWEADGTYYTMLVNVSQNDVPAEKEKGLTGYLYEAGTDTVVGTAIEGTGVVYNDTAGQFTVKFKMEDITLTHDTSYDLRLVENNGTEYTSNTLTFTYPTTINLAKVGGDSTLVGTPGSTYTYRRSTDAGGYVITSNNPAVASYRLLSSAGTEYTDAIDTVQQTDDGYVLTISSQASYYSDFILVAYDAEGNELSHIILDIVAS